ncbi:MAG: (2Fe-2S)-binding protein, partial [Pseudomonadota bacterium]
MSEFSFTFDGAPVLARTGDTIAAALEAADVRTLGKRRGGRPRGVFCGMGACQDCLVSVDGRLSERACLVEAAPGLVVGSQEDGLTTPGQAPLDAEPPEDHSCDLAVLGAGPAGLEAALAADAAGLSAIAIDERSAAGGQYYKPRSSGYRAKSEADAQHREGDALRARLARSGVVLRAGEMVWYARREAEGFVLRSVREGRQAIVRARTVVVAAGAVARPAVVPGWTLPGVLTIGA